MTILDVLKALRDRGLLWSKEHPTLPRHATPSEQATNAARMGIRPEMVRGKMVLASNAEMRRWCKTGGVVIYREGQLAQPTYLDAPDVVPEDAVCLQLFPKGRTITMPFPWGVMG